jgi:hypothetical protein
VEEGRAAHAQALAHYEQAEQARLGQLDRRVPSMNG